MKTLEPELATFPLALTTRVLQLARSAAYADEVWQQFGADEPVLTIDTEAAVALANAGWCVSLAEGYDPVTWRVRSPTRALADARALLDEVSA